MASNKDFAARCIAALANNPQQEDAGSRGKGGQGLASWLQESPERLAGGVKGDETIAAEWAAILEARVQARVEKRKELEAALIKARTKVQELEAELASF